MAIEDDLFDIRRYENLGPGKGAIDPDVLIEANKYRNPVDRNRRINIAQANRQARINRYGLPQVERMEQAGRTFQGGVGRADVRPAIYGPPRPEGLGVNARQAPGATAGVADDVATQATRGGRLRSLGGRLRGLGRGLARGLARATGPLALGVGTLNTLGESTAERDRVLRKLGLEEQNDRGQGTGYFSLANRYAGFAPRVLNNTLFGVPERLLDAAAGRGYDYVDRQRAQERLAEAGRSFEPVAARVGEQYFAPRSIAGAVGARQTARDVVSGQTPPGRPQPRRITDPAELAEANAFIDSAEVPASGTGFMRNNQTGEIIQFGGNPRGPGVAGEPAAPRRRISGTGMPIVDAVVQEAFRQYPKKIERSVAAGRTARLKALADLMNARNAQATKDIQIEFQEGIPGGPGPQAFRFDKRTGRGEKINIYPQGRDAPDLIEEARQRVAAGQLDKDDALTQLAEYGILLDDI